MWGRYGEVWGRRLLQAAPRRLQVLEERGLAHQLVGGQDGRERARDAHLEGSLDEDEHVGERLALLRARARVRLRIRVYGSG